MTHIRNDRTRRQRRRAGTTLVLAAATGGLLAAAMAGSPTARADDLADITADSQAATALGEVYFTTASTDFALNTTAGTDAGLVLAFAGFDDLFLSPLAYTAVGLTGEAEGVDISSIAGDYDIQAFEFPLSASGETADATTYTTYASTAFTDAETAFSAGGGLDDTIGVDYLAYGAEYSILAEQATILASLF